MYCIYCAGIWAIGMSRISIFCLLIRWSNRSSGPSKASRNISSASGGIYRSLGISDIGSPCTIAKGISAWLRVAVTGVISLSGIRLFNYRLSIVQTHGFPDLLHGLTGHIAGHLTTVSDDRLYRLLVLLIFLRPFPDR